MADLFQASDRASPDFTATLRAELGELESDVSSMAGAITKDLAKALVNGQELDGLLGKLILRQADSALNQALSPVYSMVGSLGENLVGSLVGGLSQSLGSLGGSAPPTSSAPANIFNVQVAAQDPASFRNSETQLAASLSRAVARGSRAM